MIETKRCKLLRLQETDFNDVSKLYIDQKVRRFLGGTVDEQTCKEKFQNILKSKDKLFYWIIRKKEDNKLIGLVSLSLHHDGINTEVSYQLLPKWWGYGYATEVIKEVITYAFKELNLSKVVAETQIANKYSCKLLNRVGMSLEQTIERFDEEQGIFSIYNHNHE